MRDNERVAFVVNPHSAHGRTARRWSSAERQLREIVPEFDVFRTEHPGHATELTRQALWQGYGRIISVGGDGTHHEVMNGFFEGAAPINPDAVMGILPFGTGSDLARTLRIPRSRAALRYIASDSIVTADVGRITYTMEHGEEGMCHCLNTVHNGMGAEIGYKVNVNTKAFGGFPSFFWATITTIGHYAPHKMRIRIDELEIEQEVLDCIVCNGAYDGGGMHVAPQSELDDGLFDIYLIGRIAAWDALLNLHKLYRGKLTKRPDIVKYFRGKCVRLEASERVRISPDGESPGYLPATIQIVPRALKVIAGWTPVARVKASKPERRATPAAAATAVR